MYVRVTISDNDFIPSLCLAVQRLFDILVHERRKHYDGVENHTPLNMCLAHIHKCGLLIPWIDTLCQAEQMVGIVELAQRGCWCEQWESRLYTPDKEIFGDAYLHYIVSFTDDVYKSSGATMVELNLITGECLGYSG